MCFDINLITAEKSNLKIRSDLLSLARRIIN
ncbi:MAG: YfiR family protein [Proteobacteria bacterium]|nr:YfiR family protein [Pseudomonadota bacterium]